MTKIKEGDKVSFHFIGTFDDGEQFDNSYDRGDPVTCTVGAGEVIDGFNNALIGMSKGETKRAELDPSEAYGERKEDAVADLPKSLFDNTDLLSVGATVYGKRQDGEQVLAKICEIKENDIVVDFNHPMAGMNLNFDITVVEIEES
jgi:FKBP-type peptidyl-prolyl cis-trans isomerase 2